MPAFLFSSGTAFVYICSSSLALLCRAGWPRTPESLLWEPPQCWDYRPAPLCSTHLRFLQCVKLLCDHSFNKCQIKWLGTVALTHSCCEDCSRDITWTQEFKIGGNNIGRSCQLKSTKWLRVTWLHSISPVPKVSKWSRIMINYCYNSGYKIWLLKLGGGGPRL